MSVHDQVHAFADGELTPEEAEKFRDHLADCRECQTELQEILQLQALSWKPPVGGNVVPLVWWKRRRTLTVAGTMLAMAAGFALFVRLPGGEDFTLGTTRRLEARVSDPRGDSHRPYDVERGGATKARPNLKLLARLEEKGDWRGLADAWLLAGEPDQAAAHLEKLGNSPEADNDRAVFYLERGDAESAISFADRALRARAGMTQALWNLALAERDLGLIRVAAKSFGEVAARGEPGWAEEALQRKKTLDDEAAAEDARWKAIEEAGPKMVAGGPPIPLELARSAHGAARRYLYNSLRSATTKARALELKPLAHEIDQLDHGSELERFADRVAGSDFVVRGPLAALYNKLATGAGPKDAKEKERLIASFEQAHLDDLALGALQLTNLAYNRVAEFRKLAEGDRDLSAMGAYYAAGELVGKNQTLAAVALLEKSIADCDHGVQLRCANNERLLAENLIAMHRVAEARAVLLSAWQRGRRAGDEGLNQQILDQLGELHLIASRFALVRAYLSENVLRHPDDLATQGHAHETMALSYVAELDKPAALAEIAVVQKSGRGLDGNGVWALADLSHQGLAAEQRKLGVDAVQALRKVPGLAPSDFVILDSLEGRLVIDDNAVEGKKLLSAAIAGANKLAREEADAQKGRAISYQTLIATAAQTNDWSRALALFAEETGLATPADCAVAVAIDNERQISIVRAKDGQLRGQLTTRLRPVIDPATFVAGLPTLEGCSSVAVLARPPLFGSPDLLPPSFAWSYRVGHPQLAQLAQPARAS
jgi:hypothetical protein